MTYLTVKALNILYGKLINSVRAVTI